MMIFRKNMRFFRKISYFQKKDIISRKNIKVVKFSIKSNFKSNYSKYVIIPEGIIYFLMNKFSLNYKIAEQIYVTTTAALEEGPKTPEILNSSNDITKITYEFIPSEFDDSFDEIPDFD